MLYQSSLATEGDSKLSDSRRCVERVIPPGATHFAVFYGERSFYQAVHYQHMNQVSEVLQILVRWNVWDNGRWTDVGGGFSARLLREIETAQSSED